MTPILGILVAIGSGLALVAVAIILVLKFRPSHATSYPNTAQRRHKDRTYISAPHLPLNHHHHRGGGGGEMPDECIDLEEKDPDVIPANKDIIEEEEAFQAYAEQRRYASTLGRSCLASSNNATSSSSRSNFKGNISRFVSLALIWQIWSINTLFIFRAKKSPATPNGPCPG